MIFEVNLDYFSQGNVATMVIVYSLPQEFLLLHRLCCSYKIFQRTTPMVKIPTARLMMH